jgi:hypothetical protein
MTKATMTPEMRDLLKNNPSEFFRLMGARGGKKRKKNSTPEQRSAWSAKAAEVTTPAQRKRWGRKGAKARAAKA